MVGATGGATGGAEKRGSRGTAGGASVGLSLSGSSREKPPKPAKSSSRHASGESRFVADPMKSAEPRPAGVNVARRGLMPTRSADAQQKTSPPMMAEAAPVAEGPKGAPLPQQQQRLR